jgi:putative tryptophan/tyrosine transport system substrate-binding protein
VVRLPSAKRATTFGRRGDPMRRRELVLLLGGAMMTARILRAQQKATAVIGVLCSTSPGPNTANVAAFRQGLSDIGYVEGQNLAIEYRWVEGHHDRLPALFADLVGRKVDAIIAMGATPSALAAKNATSTIPIVFLVSPGRVRPRRQSRAARRQRDRRRHIHP